MKGALALRLRIIEKLRRDLVQACLDWSRDTGACHLCAYDCTGTAIGGTPTHDDECPVGKLRALGCK